MKNNSRVMSKVISCLKEAKYSASLFTLLILLFVIACSKKDSVAPAVAKGVIIKADPTHGNVLTDDLGNTLYVFAQDFAGLNTCQGACTASWPIFHLSNITIGTDLDQADFSEITNTDGTKQTTFKGWPLYYYSGDKKAGDATGDNVNHVWYFAKADYSVMVGVNASGKKYLVAPKGRTLYTFDNDVNANVSTCTGTCLTSWPAFSKTNANIVVPSLLSASNFGTTTGGQQFIYNGHPLYYYRGDINRGDANGLSISTWHELDETKF